jgi:hypothetical protein
MHTAPFRDRGRLWIAAAAGVAALVLALCGPGSPAAAQSTPTDSGTPLVAPSSPGDVHELHLPLISKAPIGSTTALGVQVYCNPTSACAALPLAVQAHVAYLRWPVAWSSVEPSNTTPDKYNWGWLDTQVLAARQSGLRLVITIGGNPTWAATYPGGPIDKVGLNEFAQFMGAMAERYDGDGWQDAPGSPVVDYWELYNEPDSGSLASARDGQGYWGHSGAAYAKMLCAVFPAVKAASPNEKVALGGMAYDYFEEDGGPFVRSFLDDVLAAGGGKCMDVLAFHYYPGYEPVWSAYGPGLTGKANYLRSKLEAYDVHGMPMIVTETGHHSNNYPVWPSTPEIQAGYVVKLSTQSLASGLEVMIWWLWSDYEILPPVWGENGLLDRNLQPKLSYYAFKEAATELSRAVFQRILSSGELGGADVQGYLFDRGTPLYVLWANGQNSESVRLPGSSARVTDYVGKTLANISDADDGNTDGRVRVTVGSKPIYVEVTP